MSNIISVGFITEGTTDDRYLSDVIRQTVEAVATECTMTIDVHSVGPIEVPKSDVKSRVHAAARKAFNEGIMVVCVHTDADAKTDKDAFTYRINPAFESVLTAPASNLCRNLVAVVPVHMIEAWMLADKSTLKREMDTTLSDAALGIDRSPERIADPKACLEEAIRRSSAHKPRRHRRDLTISDLYERLGTKADLNQLARLPSYQKFQQAVRNAFRRLGYLH